MKEVPLTPGPEAVSIVAHESRVDRESNPVPVHPITTGSAKLPDWLIKEAEETLENNIRDPQKKHRKRGSYAKGQLPNFIFCTLRTRTERLKEEEENDIRR